MVVDASQYKPKYTILVYVLFDIGCFRCAFYGFSVLVVHHRFASVFKAATPPPVAILAFATVHYPSTIGTRRGLNDYRLAFRIIKKSFTLVVRAKPTEAAFRFPGCFVLFSIAAKRCRLAGWAGMNDAFNRFAILVVHEMLAFFA